MPDNPCPQKDLCPLLPVALRAACGVGNMTCWWIIQAEDRGYRGEERERRKDEKRKNCIKIPLRKGCFEVQNSQEKSFYSFTGFSSHYNKRNIRKSPPSHHRPSPLLITFRLGAGNLWVKESHFETRDGLI